MGLGDIDLSLVQRQGKVAFSQVIHHRASQGRAAGNTPLRIIVQRVHPDEPGAPARVQVAIWPGSFTA